MLVLLLSVCLFMIVTFTIYHYYTEVYIKSIPAATPESKPNTTPESKPNTTPESKPNTTTVSNTSSNTSSVSNAGASVVVDDLRVMDNEMIYSSTSSEMILPTTYTNITSSNDEQPSSIEAPSSQSVGIVESTINNTPPVDLGSAAPNNVSTTPSNSIPRASVMSDYSEFTTIQFDKTAMRQVASPDGNVVLILENDSTLQIRINGREVWRLGTPRNKSYGSRATFDKLNGTLTSYYVIESGTVVVNDYFGGSGDVAKSLRLYNSGKLALVNVVGVEYAVANHSRDIMRAGEMLQTRDVVGLVSSNGTRMYVSDKGALMLNDGITQVRLSADITPAGKAVAPYVLRMQDGRLIMRNGKKEVVWTFYDYRANDRMRGLRVNNDMTASIIKISDRTVLATLRAM